jgi:hypothetical protein
MPLRHRKHSDFAMFLKDGILGVFVCLNYGKR